MDVVVHQYTINLIILLVLVLKHVTFSVRLDFNYLNQLGGSGKFWGNPYVEKAMQ